MTENINLEKVSCLICGNYNEKVYYTVKDHRYEVDDRVYKVVKCENCGLVYLNPRPDRSSMNHYYPSKYFNNEIDKDLLLKKEAQRITKKFKYLPNEKGKLLDIGCRTGDFLYYAKENGWTVYGLEFAENSNNLFDLSIFYGDITDYKMPNNFF